MRYTYPPLKLTANIATENRHFQEEMKHLPTIELQGVISVSFRQGNPSKHLTAGVSGCN